ncbi:MAG TPA: DsbA family protein [Azospirillaceae bacterium]|nr:DsbA family protein [Azospirillaceae bacterium]
MKDTKVVIDFYHDVVCSWCFVMSPRLRIISKELPIEVRHRSFVLQDSREEMVRRWGSLEDAKTQIMGHWAACAEVDDYEGRINVEGMMRQTFEYPSGLAGTLACKAAEIQGGQEAHWDMFDAVQKAHLTDSRNIADTDVLMDVARQVGLKMDRFEVDFLHPETRRLVEVDRAEARRLGIRSIPSLVIMEAGILMQTTPLPELRENLKAVQAHLETARAAGTPAQA